MSNSKAAPARLVFCPICGNNDAGAFQPIHPGTPDAVRCLVCRLGIETNLQISRDCYKAAVYDVARNAGAGGDRWKSFHHDSSVAQSRLQQLDKLLRGIPVTGRPRSWLDVGCGNAALLAMLRRRGWAVGGVEADVESCRELGDRLGISAIDFANWVIASQGPAAGSVQVISFFDSLEHLIDPVGAAMIAAMASAPGGLIVIEAPDLDQADDFPRWKHRRIHEGFTEHIWHFSSGPMEMIRQQLPDFELVHFERPVPGRFQLAWKNMRKSPEIRLPGEAQSVRPFTITTK